MTDTALDPSALSGLELLRALTAAGEQRPNIGALLGMTVERLDPGEVVFALRTRPDFANPLGITHGGICATILDSVMGCAVHTTLEAGIGYTTLELKVNYIRAVSVDDRALTATGTVVHAGRRTATAEGKVVDEQGRLVAHATTTCLILR
ncbi:PaaI family thioesterase [Nocardia thailandica]|uniref:PaaI family thioesterase n=1 Tax=Nocardia thailandica TaxID=257275 RepID=UPI0002DDC156|nr:PaaI family thioesterase [Nocardia thailandica]